MPQVDDIIYSFKEETDGQTIINNQKERKYKRRFFLGVGCKGLDTQL